MSVATLQLYAVFLVLLDLLAILVLEFMFSCSSFPEIGDDPVILEY